MTSMLGFVFSTWLPAAILDFPLAAIRSRFVKARVWFLKVDGPVTQSKFQNLLRMSCIRGPGQGQDYTGR